MLTSALKSRFTLAISLIAISLVVGTVLLTLPSAKAKDEGGSVEPRVIIDVRTPAEFSAGHIIGAINIPVDRIEQEIRSVQGIDKNSPILLYCRTGNRSGKARQILIQQGYTQVFNGGGLEAMAQKRPSCSQLQC